MMNTVLILPAVVAIAATGLFTTAGPAVMDRGVLGVGVTDSGWTVCVSVATKVGLDILGVVVADGLTTAVLVHPTSKNNPIPKMIHFMDILKIRVENAFLILILFSSQNCIELNHYMP